MDKGLDQLKIYQVAREIGTLIYEIYPTLPRYVQFSHGDQAIRAAGSIGANIAEGYGRFTHKDRIRFLRISRASAYELKHWVSVIHELRLIDSKKYNKLIRLITREIYLINRYIAYLKKTSS